MRLWITGMRGFLGRHVAQEALRRGHELFRLDVDLAADDLGGLVPKLDAVIHCAGVTRWSPKPQSDVRFAANVLMAFRVVQGVPKGARFVVPMPHGALAPWNAYTQSVCAALEQFGVGRNAPPVPVYLPTLYGLGDPHHAKAIPSFLLAATGKGEQAIVLYPPGDVWRQFMSVEKAAQILVDRAEGKDADGPEVVEGEPWYIRALAETVRDIAAKYGRKLAIEERGWQWKPDGLGVPVPSAIGPESAARAARPAWLEKWLDKVIGDALKAEAYAKGPAVTSGAIPGVTFGADIVRKHTIAPDPMSERRCECGRPSRPADDWCGVGGCMAPPDPPAPALAGLSAAAKDYMILALRSLANPSEDDDERLDQMDRYWEAMSADERHVVEKLVAEEAPGAVVSADAPPTPPASPAAPLHDDGLPNSHS